MGLGGVEPQCETAAQSPLSAPPPPRESGLGETGGCWARLASISSCRAFSYSVCFPCCICSFVKLACSSPAHLYTPINYHLPSLFRVWVSNISSFTFNIKEKCTEF